MTQQTQIHNLAGRLAMVLGLSLGGLVFPWLFLPAALIAWSLLEDWRKPAPAPETVPPLWRATAQTPDWEQYFLNLCESPAETAFLRAMLQAHRLLPESGRLRGAGFTLALQVKMPPYRVDFLVNDKLIVEIDGATYHSSPEARARDRQRDAALGARGYVTLRIPAKLVFEAPDVAVGQVETAWAALSVPSGPAVPATQQLGRATMKTIQGLKAMTEKFGAALEAVNQSLEDSRERQRVTDALLVPRTVFETERVHIEGAMALARQRVEIEAWLSDGEEGLREMYQQTLDELRGRVAAISDKERPVRKQTAENTVLAPFAAPPPGPSETWNQVVQAAFQQLAATRADYFAQIRLQLQSNETLCASVKQALMEFHHEACWLNIAPTPLRPQAPHYAAGQALRSPFRDAG